MPPCLPVYLGMGGVRVRVHVHVHDCAKGSPLTSLACRHAACSQKGNAWKGREAHGCMTGRSLPLHRYWLRDRALIVL
jgi:hypothetical protein